MSARFPNISDQLICWFRMAKKQVLMPTHLYMRCDVQLFSYHKKGLLLTMMELPTKQETIEQIFS